MKYCRIKLAETNYAILNQFSVILNPNIDQLNQIYKDYCAYKKFDSVMPIFDCQYKENLLIGYYDQEELSAFSMIKIYDEKNAEAIQFAWNYKNPDIRLGIRSLKSECAYLKQQGFDYYYLGQAAEYKSYIDGYEVLQANTAS